MVATVEPAADGVTLHIPAELAAAAGLAGGTPVDLTVESGRLVVSPPGRKRLTLAELVAGITPENRHDETDWGPPVGKEVW